MVLYFQSGLGGINMLSIVIPIYNEERNIPILYKSLKSVLNKYQYEIIFVDDGSTDNTFNILKTISQKDKKVKLALLSIYKSLN